MESTTQRGGNRNMRRQIVSMGLLTCLALFLALPATLHAAIELADGMSQGDFALWLVDAIGAKSKLPPAADGQDAIDFLTKLGSIPEGGWQKKEPMTKELLSSLLEKPEDGANLNWDDLVKKVRERIQGLFDNRKLGVFRVFSATPSAPAA